MAYTTPISKSTGDGLTAADWNTYIRDNTSYLYAPPRCSLTHSVPQNTTTGVTYKPSFNTEEYDTDGMHSTTTNTTRLTFNTAGVYFVAGQVIWASNTTGLRILSLLLNNSLTIASTAGTGDAWLVTSTMYYFNPGDYLELNTLQASGQTLAILVGNGSPALRAIWLGG